MKILGINGRFFFALCLAASACDCEEGSGLSNVTARLEVTPSDLDFGEVRVSEFRIRGLTVANRGQIALTFDSITIEQGTAEFAFISDRPTVLAPEQSVDLTMTYTPSEAGEDTGVIHFVLANEGVDGVDVPIRGVGIESGVGVTHDGEACDGAPGSLSFGNVGPGQSAEHTITFEATGAASVTILSAVLEPGVSTEFSLSAPAQNTTVAPGESVAIVATYTPVDGGPDSGAIVITTDSPDRPSIRIPICGAGTAPAICGRPVPLDIGVVAEGDTMQATLTFESCGAEPLEITSIALATDAQHPTHPGFSIATQPSLPATLAPTDTTRIEVAYTAPDLATANGFIRVESSAFGNSPAFFPITARGGQPCAIGLAPSQINFSNVAVGSTGQRSVLIANNGAQACSVASVDITAGANEFSVQNVPTTPATIGPGDSVVVDVTYAPSGPNAMDTGTLTVNDGGGLHTVALSGTTTEPSGCSIEARPAFLQMGVVPVGDIRTSEVELTNVGGGSCTIRRARMAAGSDPGMTETAPNLGIILSGRSKMVSVTFHATRAGPARGVLEIDTSDALQPTLSIPVFAAGGAAGICVDPVHLPFGDTPIVRTLDFRIYACGNRSVTVSALDWTTADPEMTLSNPPTLPFTLASGDSQTVTVEYRPADMTGDYAVVTVRSDDPAAPALDVRMTGGREVVPPEAGRFLYYWQIPTPIGGDIVRIPLQGATTIEPYWGPRTGKACAGCHEVSPDGRYVALLEFASFKVIDTTTDISLSLPANLLGVQYLSWRPDVNTNPPYQFAYGAEGKIKIGSVFAGALGDLAGADRTADNNNMPTWGPDGKIAFVRGAMPTASQQGGGSGYSGPTGVWTVDENGGTPTMLAGASNNNAANYYPRYSPNGRWIAITHSAMANSTIGAPDAQIKLVAADGSGTVLDLPNLNGGDGASSYATWAVNGAFISFSSNRAGGMGDWDIYVAPIDPMSGQDGAAVNFTDANSPAFEHAAQWSP